MMIKSVSVHEIDSWSSPSVAISIGVALFVPALRGGEHLATESRWGENTTGSRPVTGLLAG
ncbi:Conserved protein of unknown function (part 2) [Mycobacterium canettii CIPT 140070010]|nr:Conserved protein of unknown function (part 2) [Mycobacterium canettii CIPT 140070010]